jgi:hypothetical protein
VHLSLSGPFQYLVDLDMYMVDGVERRQKGREENTGGRLEGKEQGLDLSLSQKKRAVHIPCNSNDLDRRLAA